jgi:large repetitive protein
MTSRFHLRKATAAAVLVAAVGASVAFAHGSPDQVNDPPTTSGWYCAQEGPDRLFQGFVPGRRQLAGFDARVFRRFNFPAAGMTLSGTVHAGSGTGPALGTTTVSIADGDEDSVMVHFDFPTPITLEPQGTFVFELAHDVSGIRWMGKDGNPYAAAPSFDCGGAMPSEPVDFNFVTYAPADGGPPDTDLEGGASITRQRTAVFRFTASDDLSYTSKLVLSCHLDGRPYDPCVSPVSLAGVRDGRHTFSVGARDEAGQTDATPAAFFWTVDGTRPSRPNVVGPRRSSAARATYRFSARDGVDRPGQLRFRCALDSTRLRPCSARVTRRLAKGKHVLRVTAVDRAGNVSRTTVARIVRA